MATLIWLLLQALGYDCGRLTCDGWLKSGKLQEFFSSQISSEEQIKVCNKGKNMIFE